MLADLKKFIRQPLRRVLYYRTQSDANTDLNWSGFHDVGQGVELCFDTGHFFVTWDNAVEEEISIHLGRMMDFLSSGLFEDVSTHTDWQSHVGQPLEDVQLLQSEASIRFAETQVFIVTAEVDPQTLLIEGMSDNLVVFFNSEVRNDFFAQYHTFPSE